VVAASSMFPPSVIQTALALATADEGFTYMKVCIPTLMACVHSPKSVVLQLIDSHKQGCVDCPEVEPGVLMHMQMALFT
jgi:hypothetical protein